MMKKTLQIKEAEGRGFEPRLMESESTVLPLNYPSKLGKLYHALQTMTNTPSCLIRVITLTGVRGALGLTDWAQGTAV